MTEQWLGWHLLDESRTLQHTDPPVTVEAGQTYSTTGRLELCATGMHASKRALDCLDFASGTVFCQVELIGKRIDDDRKSCAQKRKVLWMVDAKMILHEFACRCAEQALDIVQQQGGTVDPRSRAAIAAKRAWMRGEMTDTELFAARAAARAAAWAAARDAARDAAWAAAWDAAWAAARAAARAAAWDAARDAAWDAAWDAARVAAWDAAWDAQNALLEQMLNEAHEAGPK